MTSLWKVQNYGYSCSFVEFVADLRLVMGSEVGYNWRGLGLEGQAQREVIR
jgi:hypothetical protein